MDEHQPGTFDERLHAAICDGYTFSTLEQMLLFRLDERLDLIVPTRRVSLKEEAFELIKWARKMHRVPELACEAWRFLKREGASNPELECLAAEVEPEYLAQLEVAGRSTRDVGTTAGVSNRRPQGDQLVQALSQLSDADLRTLVGIYLGEQPDSIAAAERQPFTARVLIEWADRRRRLADLALALQQFQCQ